VDPRLDPIPEGDVLLHIGPHKTGTTAVQGALKDAAEEVRALGVDYLTAGTWARPAKAGWAFGLSGAPIGIDPPPPWHWRKLVREVAESTAPRRCVSNEDFGRARADQLPELVEALGGDRIHVLAVARRLDTMLPSLWQERVKHGESRTFDAWLRPVLDVGADGEDWDRTNVWHAHDTGALVARWQEHVPADRITVVSLDETRRDQLPGVVADLLGLPHELMKPRSRGSNRGLAWAECELIRQVNAGLGDDWPIADQRRYLYSGAVRELQRHPAPDGPKYPPFPAWSLPVLEELSARRVAALRDLPAGVTLVGDPAVMALPTDLPSATEDPAPPPLDYELAARAVTAAITSWRAREEKAEEKAAGKS
jgi:hypothetical protein